MLSMRIVTAEIVIKDIKRRDLPNIIKWYNGGQDYKYATGMDQPVTLEILIQKYLEVVYCGSEFFAGIQLKHNNDMIGLIKGRLKKGKVNSIWINSLIIDARYRGGGYGTKSLNMISEYFKSRYDIKKIFISVIMENQSGIRFWHKNGFKSIRKTNIRIMLNGKGHNVVLMEKEV